jgi:predicted nucleic acid-binding protein
VKLFPVADTSFVVGVLSRTDRAHGSCVELYQAHKRILLPQTVLNEVAYLIGTRAGSEYLIQFLRGLPQSHFTLVEVDQPILDRTADLLVKYADSRLDFVDATIIALAERINSNTIFTLDRRDFHLVKPSHCDRFTLLPDPTSF